MSQREIECRAKQKLAVLRHVDEISGNVAATCRYYSISRQAYYKWKRRYEEQVFDGLKDRVSEPHHQPNKTAPEVIEKVVWLRQQYHFGPHKIAMYLARYHDIMSSPSGVWRTLKKVGLSRFPASQRYKRAQTRWKRYEKQLPSHALQIDVKLIEPLVQIRRKKRYYQ